MFGFFSLFGLLFGGLIADAVSSSDGEDAEATADDAGGGADDATSEGATMGDFLDAGFASEVLSDSGGAGVGAPELPDFVSAFSADWGESGSEDDGADTGDEPSEFGLEPIPATPQVLQALVAGGILSGGTADDMLDGSDKPDFIGGRDGDDAIVGGAGDDVLAGEGGDDTLAGGAGDDSLSGGAGNDGLAGEGGDDSLYGGTGDDTLAGDDGTDSLVGGDGADLIAGGEGDDTLAGGFGDDVLWGEGGADLLQGGAGDDTLLGAESLTPGGTEAADFLNGGAGGDIIVAGAGDIASGGEGGDTFAIGDWIGAGAPVAHVTDYDPDADRLVVVYDAEAHPDPLVEVLSDPFQPGTATITLDGVPLAVVSGSGPLLPSQLTLIAHAG